MAQSRGRAVQLWFAGETQSSIIQDQSEGKTRANRAGGVLIFFTWGGGGTTRLSDCKLKKIIVLSSFFVGMGGSGEAVVFFLPI